MLKIEVHATGEGPARDKVGRAVRDGLKEQMGATPWELTVYCHEQAGFKPVSSAKYINEGSPRI